MEARKRAEKVLERAQDRKGDIMEYRFFQDYKIALHHALYASSRAVLTSKNVSKDALRQRRGTALKQQIVTGQYRRKDR